VLAGEGGAGGDEGGGCSCENDASAVVTGTGVDEALRLPHARRLTSGPPRPKMGACSSHAQRRSHLWPTQRPPPRTAPDRCP
jgi:hypothetical protein